MANNKKTLEQDNNEPATAIGEALRGLAKQVTKTSIVRNAIADIEKAKEEGISNKAIVETISAHGITIDEKSFASLLSRIRRELLKSNKSKKV